MPSLPQKLLQQEGQEVGKGIELPIETYILIAELDTIMNVTVFFLRNQSFQGNCRIIVGFHLNGNQAVCIPHKEVHLQGGILLFVIVEAIALLGLLMLYLKCKFFQWNESVGN